MNKYIDLNRIEFIVTNQCTGKCKHCSIGDKKLNSKEISINKQKALDVIAKLSQIYEIESVMTFGGEPLIYPDTTCAIHNESAKCGISRRQIITNGYFSKDTETIKKVARDLKSSGVNSLLLSVDVFHQEIIPVEYVYEFAKQLVSVGVENLELHPAWVINEQNDNEYNAKTTKYLEMFRDLEIKISGGNNIFPSGNAAKYLSEFYEKKPINLETKCGDMPYTTPLDNVDTLSISPSGNVYICAHIIGNVYENDIQDIIENYNPYEKKEMQALLCGGVKSLVDYAKSKDIEIDVSEHYSACGVCRATTEKMRFGETQE